MCNPGVSNYPTRFHLRLPAKESIPGDNVSSAGSKAPCSGARKVPTYSETWKARSTVACGQAWATQYRAGDGAQPLLAR